MKKNKLENQFLEELRKVPIVQVACEKTGLSRQSVYRWRKEDKEFAKKMDQSIKEGVEFVNDMSESQLLQLIKNMEFPAIRFWLSKRHSAYKDKIEIQHKAEDDELTPEQADIVRKALNLGSIINDNNEIYGS